MNLSQLRKLVEQTRHLPDNTVLVMPAGTGQTFHEIRGISPFEVRAFKRPRSTCPLGAVFHGKASPEAFGCRSEAELDDVAPLETVLLVS